VKAGGTLPGPPGAGRGVGVKRGVEITGTVSVTPGGAVTVIWAGGRVEAGGVSITLVGVLVWVKVPPGVGLELAVALGEEVGGDVGVEVAVTVAVALGVGVSNGPGVGVSATW
jgi:hypothetical protein